MPRSRGTTGRAARRPSRLPLSWLDLLSLALLVVFGLVVLGPALVGRGALIDLNVLSGAMPTRALVGPQVARTITCRTDTVDYYLPGIQAIKQGLLAGHLTTWAPYEVGGTPLASLPNHAAFSPVSLPYFLLPLWLAPAYVELAIFTVAIGGMVLFLGRHGISRGAGVLAGLTFVTCGFMMMWSNWPHVKVACFIPALFWALERLVRDRRPRDVVLVAVVVASMLLGGFPAVTLFSLTLAAAYLVVRVLTLYRGRVRRAVAALLGAAAGVLLGAGLSAVQLLPFALNLGNLGLAERQQDGFHLPLGLFLTSFAPDTVGRCIGGVRYGSTNPIEAIGYVGAAALVVAVSAVALRLPSGAAPDRSPRVFLAGAVAVVVLLVWTGGPLLSMLQRLPLYSSNNIGRAQSIFGFLAAALVGVGIDRLARALPERPASGRIRLAQRLPGVLVALVVVGFLVAAAVAARSEAADQGFSAHLEAALLVPLLLLGVALVCVLLVRFGPRRLRVGALVLVILVLVAQNTAFAHSVLPRSDPDLLYPPTPTRAYLQQHLGDDRYGAGDHTMQTATSDWYKLRTPVGHEFTQSTWRDLLLAADPNAFRFSRTFSVFSRLLTLPLAGGSPILDQLGVRYWVADPNHIRGRYHVSGGPDRLLLGRDTPLTCRIPAGALRGIRVRAARGRPVPVRGPAAALHVTVHTPTGVRRGTRLLEQPVARGPYLIGVAGEDLRGRGSYRVDLRVTGLRGPLQLVGTDSRPVCDEVRPVDDGLRLVLADAGSTVYRRLDALPRLRWASRSRVVPDAQTRIADLRRGVPDDTVLLDDDRTPAAGGGGAQVQVLGDAPGRIALRVQDASAPGYVVVADAVVRAGWRATVDGRSAPLVHGNHAFGAVPVPQGSHTVLLTYTAPGLATGALVSAGSALAAVLLIVVPTLLRRGRRTSRGRARGYADEPDPVDAGPEEARVPKEET